jgi:cytochrome c553
MKLKLAIFLLFISAMIAPAALRVVAFALPTNQTAQEQDTIIKLDTKGYRGVVYFSHRGHEALISPDPEFVYKAKAKPNAACAGCHHTESKRGIPQLWKCVSCHKGEANEKNPKNRDFDEVYAERAFHDMCIGCHRANYTMNVSVKGPTTCGGCHKAE